MRDLFICPAVKDDAGQPPDESSSATPAAAAPTSLKEVEEGIKDVVGGDWVLASAGELRVWSKSLLRHNRSGIGLVYPETSSKKVVRQLQHT
ncbi:hypothetical protein GBF38_000916 [Nibea albiflora]|nr:hypothetical protein GBF38_000916 [Nibea albiflora]